MGLERLRAAAVAGADVDGLCERVIDGLTDPGPLPLPTT